MCARYDLSSPPYWLIERFGLTVPPMDAASGKPDLPGLGMLPREVRPTDAAPVIDPLSRAHALRWGLQVSWSARPVINARSETLADKPTFRHLLGNRALVPVDGWYEWSTDYTASPTEKSPEPKTSGRKTKVRISAETGLVALAALVDAKAGRFVILTCSPAPSIAGIHSRMPVVLNGKDAEAAWMAGRGLTEDLAELLVPYPGALRHGAADPPASASPEKPGADPAQGSLF
ncbi:MAG: SOS response-associated peptidase [Rhodospirillaceae bacterium]